MAVVADLFDAQFAHFRKIIRQASGAEFRSFNEGLAAEWESYKPRLWERARGLMEVARWREDTIGKGNILDRVIASIEIRDRNDPNNLVRWENRFGHASRSHYALLDARLAADRREAFERLFFDFYNSGALDDAAAFENLCLLAGARYDLLAYLFFLKDMQQFMPIAAETFDQAFKSLGIDLQTSGRCSWENYTRYNHALADIREALRDRAGLRDVRLIDAHSFCWMLIRIEKERVNGTVARASTTRGRNPVTVYDARQKSIWEMANSIEQTVRNANGQIVARTVKAKGLLMNRIALETFLVELMDKQENRCALTGILFKFHGDNSDSQLLPSPDRIDSNGHYEPSNIQIVCRFVNFWKGDSDNLEFLRLLDLVRENGGNM